MRRAAAMMAVGLIFAGTAVVVAAVLLHGFIQTMTEKE